MNIQDKMQEIHHTFGVTEKANYEIQLFVEALLKEQKEQLFLSSVTHRRELLDNFADTWNSVGTHAENITDSDIEYYMNRN